MITETTPTNTPAPAAATPAAVVQSAPAVQATETPAPQTAVATDPFDPAALQARIDAFLATKPAAPAATETPAAPAASATPAAPAAETTPAAAADAAAAPTESTTDTPAAESQTPTPELVVDLPPRNANGAPLKIAAPDAATADALRRLNNGYMRGEEARTKLAEADAALARVREVEIMLDADPLGLVERMPAAQRVNVARAMLAEHFEELRPVIQSWWDDESERRLARAEGLESRDKARSTYQTHSTVAKQVRAVADAVRGLIPETADTADAQEFYQDAVRYLAGVADSRGDNGIVTPQEVSQLLEKRLQRYGFNKPAANTPAAATTTTTTPAPAASPAPAAQPAAAPAAAAPNVVRVHAINQQRAAAAATTTVGAGATPVTALPKPPKGLTIEQAADWALAQRRAAGQ